MICAMHNDFDNLNMLRPNSEPRTTEYIEEIIQFIQGLFSSGHAYVAVNGDVMFSIKNYKNYGSLSLQNFDKLRITCNIPNKYKNIKKNLKDFVLWKICNSKNFVWNSPWGDGRPGWHVGCSVMNTKNLGCHFDIHGGGSDLIFPHHENELAQSVSLYGGSYVNIWMHVGLVTLEYKKISKSLNNFLNLRDVLRMYDGEVIRYFLISLHYRKPLNYTIKNFENSYIALRRLYISLFGMNMNISPKENSKNYLYKFCMAMNDDFNIPKAFSILFDISRKINKLKIVNFNKAQELAARLKQLANILGFLQKDPSFFLKNGKKENTFENTKIEMLIKERDKARSLSQWYIADTIRNKLFKMGIFVEDTAHGTLWYR